MALTKKQYFTNQYLEFKQELGTIIPTHFLPSLDNVDLIDVIYFFNYKFGDVTDFNPVIIELLISNNIQLTESQFIQLIPIFNTYITRFKSVI